jgi:hypothetical protein
VKDVSEVESDALWVIFTMDCLPAGDVGEIRGPGRWDEAERSARSFADALAAQGFTGTFFVEPSTLKRFKGLTGELAEGGHEIGLLCHPQLCGYRSYLGSYSYDRQREIVGTVRKTWEDVLGTETGTFRSGFFSANDYTYHVLCMEGFRQGSCSLPGRMDGEQCSMWYGSYPFPHHTDPLDRTIPGTMEFLEVPVTSDFEAASYLSYETYTPPHMRIEAPDLHDYARNLAVRQIGRMAEDGVTARALNLVTSNVVGWGQKDDPHADRLQNVCEMLREVSDASGLVLRNESLQVLHDEFDDAVRPDWTAEEAG